MRIYIVTEGGERMGFGHITRCLSICQAFMEFRMIPHFIVNGDESIQGLLNNIDHETFDWIDNQKRLLATIGDADVVFVDSYYADYSLYRKISNEVKIAVYLDDNMRLEYPKGFVLNGAISAEELPYPEKEGVTYLLGSQYTPLRKEFWNVSEKQICNSLKTVMVTFGGADIQNLTPKVLEMLINTYPELLTKVIIGTCFQNTEEIEKIKGNNIELIYSPNAAKMKEIMFESDIAISAGGQTLYELARIGVPTIAITVAENQLRNVQSWLKEGFIEQAGWWADEDLMEKIKQSIEILQDYTIRMNKKKAGNKVIDGSGSMAVAQRVLYSAQR
ncbi:MAG: UDP-2,4-diacetamido-2,4,6-trideoxy-beta-L-altropyranose hydrolase [Planctomycetota bacterium]|jgi:UDP-2,4-diacetamido-2,4,6-trideoxy-beta-L-altropyranose hydrolase